MKLSRRSIFRTLLVAPLAKLLPRVPNLEVNYGSGWIPLSEFTKTVASAEALRADAFGVWSDALVFEVNRPTYMSAFMGPGGIIDVEEEGEESSEAEA